MKPITRKINAHGDRKTNAYWASILQYARKPINEFLILTGLSFATLYSSNNNQENQPINPAKQPAYKIEEQKLINFPDVVEDQSLEAEISRFTFNEEEFKKAFRRIARYSLFIQQASKDLGVEKESIEAITYVESEGNPYAVSHKGARGLMQLMPETGKMYGLARWELEDQELNIRTGSAHYKGLLRKYNSNKLALIAYNWGEGNLDRLLEAYRKNNVKPTWDNIKRGIPDETAGYVIRFFGALKKLHRQKNPSNSFYK